MPENRLYSNIEERLRTITRMPDPSPRFIDGLWSDMEAQSRSTANKTEAGGGIRGNLFQHFRTIGRGILGLAATGALIALLIWTINLLPGEVRNPIGSETGEAIRATPTLTPPPTASPTIPVTFNIPNQIAPGVCNTSLEDTFDNNHLPAWQLYTSHQMSVASGGIVESGDFSLGVWLVCSEGFKQQTESSDEFSEINGLGLIIYWEYHGPDMEGEIREYMGFEPYVQAHGSSGPISNNISGYEIQGIQFPVGIIPDFSQTDTPLRYVVKTSTPDGHFAGAALTFVLARQADGYLPVDIQVTPLAADELQAGTDIQSLAIPPFPTLNPLQIYPELQEAQELIARYENPLRSALGWIYVRTRMQSPDGNGLYGSLTEWICEDWLELDGTGLVITAIHVERREDGQVLQQTVSSGSMTHNLTYAIDGEFTPYPIDLSGGLYTTMLSRLRSGASVERVEIQVDGRPAWLYIFTDAFDESLQIDEVSTVALHARNAYDQESGAPLFSELARTLPDGQESLVWRLTYEQVERVPEPPEEILALLGQTPSGYQPKPAEGTPPPEGFDPAASALTLLTTEGDDFMQPTFFYGDIYAGEYLLGRVDFGAVPGGYYCDRSADRSRLAFGYLVIYNVMESRTTLHWLDLEDVSLVYAPAPDLAMISPVT